MTDEQLLELALRSLQASMRRMDQASYEDALAGRLVNNPVTVIHLLNERLKSPEPLADSGRGQP